MIRQITLSILMTASLCSAVAQSNPPAASATPLPDGPGKPVIQRACVSCHSAAVITSKRASSDGWTQIVNEMVSRGADLSDDEIDLLIKYLSTNFGPSVPKSDHPSSTGATSQPSTPDNTAPPSNSDASTPPTPSTTSAQVNVNKADAQELESSLGISRTAAEAIVQYRDMHGNFKTWQEVSSIPGVPCEKIEDNQKRLTF
jgi:competence ComEA-like helix-hairpin-helix protein